MVEPRLKSKITVSAYLRMGDQAGKPGAVIRRGDPDAGAILLLMRGREDTHGGSIVIFAQTRTAAGDPAWLRLSGDDPIDQVAADTILSKQQRFDGDLWMVEFECPDFILPFEIKLLE